MEFGKLEQVDLRAGWTTEDRGFTPWLARVENLEELGKVLNIELELEAVEKDVGSFRADIICKNTADNGLVLIENQIEKTDHRHLGQIITYAAGLRAATIIWIARDFTDEHRAALDWLNEVTSEDIAFFGIQIELWRIGNSQPAPRFNIICEPNDWANNTRVAVELNGDARPAEILRVKYWSAFKEFLKEQQSKLRSQKPSDDHWYSFGIGTSWAHTSALVIPKKGKIDVHLSIQAKDVSLTKNIFHELLKQKGNIEEQIGAALEWREMPDNKRSKIEVSTEADPYSEADWPRQFAWLQGKLEAFDSVFRPIFQQIRGQQ